MPARNNSSFSHVLSLVQPLLAALASANKQTNKQSTRKVTIWSKFCQREGTIRSVSNTDHHFTTQRSNDCWLLQQSHRRQFTKSTNADSLLRPAGELKGMATIIINIRLSSATSVNIRQIFIIIKYSKLHNSLHFGDHIIKVPDWSSILNGREHSHNNTGLFTH